MIEVRPDIAFIEKLQGAAGSQLTTCMQCGACTASCSLSVDQDVFPRKQMIMAAWGMRERLLADPYVWACHQCGDCTLSCPRGVKPGEILAALRQEQIAHYSRPRFLARWMQKPGFLPFALLFPAAIIILILSLAGTFRIPDGPVDYSKFFPHGWLNGSFTALFVLSTIGAVWGLRSFWRNMKAGLNPKAQSASEVPSPSGPVSSGPAPSRPVSSGPAPSGPVSSGPAPSGPVSSGPAPSGPVSSGPAPSGPVSSEHAPGGFFSLIGRIMRHRDFNSCEAQKNRALSHFLVFWGFILLLFVTFFAILSTVFFDYPLSLLNPIKIAGNIGALMLLTGSSLMILNRLVRRQGLRSNYTDWFFLLSFWLLTISGILVEAARFLEWGSAYHLYFFHLVMVWIIILYYPYTKFAHFMYRTLALILTRSGR